jgi:hypothetical protein
MDAGLEKGLELEMTGGGAILDVPGAEVTARKFFRNNPIKELVKPAIAGEAKETSSTLIGKAAGIAEQGVMDNPLQSFEQLADDGSFDKTPTKEDPKPDPKDPNTKPGITNPKQLAKAISEVITAEINPKNKTNLPNVLSESGWGEMSREEGNLENGNPRLTDAQLTDPVAEKKPMIDKKPRLYKNQELFPGLEIDVATWPAQQEHYAAYTPENNAIYLFAKTFDEVEAGNETVPNIAGLHEADHAQYFNLTKAQQEAVNNTVLEVIQSDPEASALFQKFLDALYSRPVGNYLQTHRTVNREAQKAIVQVDDRPGLKDARKLRGTFLGKQEEVFLSLAMTEFFAYMTTGHHQELMNTDALNSIHASECVRLASQFRERYLDNNQSALDLLRRNGGHGLYRDIPDFKKYLYTT